MSCKIRTISSLNAVLVYWLYSQRLNEVRSENACMTLILLAGSDDVNVLVPLHLRYYSHLILCFINDVGKCTRVKIIITGNPCINCHENMTSRPDRKVESTRLHQFQGCFRWVATVIKIDALLKLLSARSSAIACATGVLDQDELR